ncbi:unnamed protein product [Symbiodinium sp. CCMP2592]|nr:unnamed protein product [Symbiodinium sp. CCMP2592]CAE7599314.1 unnamed protein product [Symbiodinium sp. CCMP2592]
MLQMIRKFSVKELATRVNRLREVEATKDLLADKVSMLQKSGETYLTIKFGRLRFVDTINFCNSGLGKLIESQRKCALRAANGDAGCLDQAFPITARRHPYLSGLRDDREATNALGAFPKPRRLRETAVWDFECYHSKLAGPCSREDYDELVLTVHRMGFESLKEVHDCYLGLDVTAYADLMQVFRLNFMQRYHLDVFQYPSLPAAAWDAVLRGGCVFDLITDSRLYLDVRRAMMGGVCAVFKPRSDANFEGLEGFNDALPTKRLMYLDINSMYPDAMTKPLPVSSGYLETLPSSDADRLDWLHKLLSQENPLDDDPAEGLGYLLFVDYDFPEELHDQLDWPSPARLRIRPGDVGPYTQEAARNRPPTEKLVPFLGMHKEEGIHSKRLAFLRNHLGARIWKLHRVWSFECRRELREFMVEAYNRRRELKDAGRDLEQGFEKIAINSIYGKTVQNQEKYRNTTHYFDPVAFSRAQAGDRVADFTVDIMERDAFLGSVHRVRPPSRNINRSPLQVGWAVLELSKLKIAVQYWMGVKAALPKVVPILTDTDSMLLEIIGDCDPVKLLAEGNLTLPAEFDLIGDLDVQKFEESFANVISFEGMQKLKELQGKMGALSDECAKWVVQSVVCLAVKKYSILLSEGKEIHKAKGVPKCVRDTAKHRDYLDIHEGNAVRHDSFTQMQSSGHQVFIATRRKLTFNVLNDKAFQLTKEYCRPMGHWRNAYLGIWLRLGGDGVLLLKILEYVRGVAPTRFRGTLAVREALF